eukprot:6441198-Alexandrium_andersonii.AAC.1
MPHLTAHRPFACRSQKTPIPVRRQFRSDSARSTSYAAMHGTMLDNNQHPFECRSQTVRANTFARPAN